MKTQWSRWLAIVVAGLLAFGAYEVNVAVQTHLGEQALAQTGLNFASLQQALQQAGASGKPVFVDFSAIWCPTCRALHEKVFTDPQVKRALAARYVLARVDYEAPEAKDFMQRYGVQGFPSLLVLDSKGQLVRRVAVTVDPRQFVAEISG